MPPLDLLYVIKNYVLLPIKKLLVLLLQSYIGELFKRQPRLPVFTNFSQKA